MIKVFNKFKNKFSGLNAKDFKFFDYDDPYVKDQITKCSICGSIAVQDQYGNGECRTCGWKFSKGEVELEQKAGVSYPMLVTPTTAREEYKKGLPFKATFKEFVNGLYFYSEMLLEFQTRQDFENNAQINGILLKNLWDKVENPTFMFCG